MRDGVLFQNPKSGFQNLNPTLVSVADVFSDVQWLKCNNYSAKFC